MQVDITSLCHFTITLANLPTQCFLIDCSVIPNPNYNERQEEKTILEMQLTLFDQKLYEIKGQSMFHNGVQVFDPALQFKYSTLVEFVLDLRTKVYSCLN